jgi:hypothetical protein
MSERFLLASPPTDSIGTNCNPHLFASTGVAISHAVISISIVYGDIWTISVTITSQLYSHAQSCTLCPPPTPSELLNASNNVYETWRTYHAIRSTNITTFQIVAEITVILLTLNAWTDRHETWYVFHVTWAHLMEGLHRSSPSVIPT